MNRNVHIIIVILEILFIITCIVYGSSEISKYNKIVIDRDGVNALENTAPLPR